MYTFKTSEIVKRILVQTCYCFGQNNISDIIALIQKIGTNLCNSFVVDLRRYLNTKITTVTV